jgi:hypothetical protein
MLATIGWITLLGAGVLIEVLSRLRLTRTPTLVRACALLATSLPGRVILILLWAFVGLHLFARYTIPGG